MGNNYARHYNLLVHQKLNPWDKIGLKCFINAIGHLKYWLTLNN